MLTFTLTFHLVAGLFSGTLLYHRSPLSWYSLGERRSPKKYLGKRRYPAFPLDYTEPLSSRLYWPLTSEKISNKPCWPLTFTAHAKSAAAKMCKVAIFCCCNTINKISSDSANSAKVPPTLSRRPRLHSWRRAAAPPVESKYIVESRGSVLW